MSGELNVINYGEVVMRIVIETNLHPLASAEDIAEVLKVVAHRLNSEVKGEHLTLDQVHAFETESELVCRWKLNLEKLIIFLLREIQIFCILHYKQRENLWQTIG
jgi:hypothetical protein